MSEENNDEDMMNKMKEFLSAFGNDMFVSRNEENKNSEGIKKKSPIDLSERTLLEIKTPYFDENSICQQLTTKDIRGDVPLRKVKDENFPSEISEFDPVESYNFSNCPESLRFEFYNNDERFLIVHEKESFCRIFRQVKSWKTSYYCISCNRLQQHRVYVNLKLGNLVPGFNGNAHRCMLLTKEQCVKYFDQLVATYRNPEETRKRTLIPADRSQKRIRLNSFQPSTVSPKWEFFNNDDKFLIVYETESSRRIFRKVNGKKYFCINCRNLKHYIYAYLKLGDPLNPTDFPDPSNHRCEALNEEKVQQFFRKVPRKNNSQNTSLIEEVVRKSSISQPFPSTLDYSNPSRSHSQEPNLNFEPDHTVTRPSEERIFRNNNNLSTRRLIRPSEIIIMIKEPNDNSRYRKFIRSDDKAICSYCRSTVAITFLFDGSAEINGTHFSDCRTFKIEDSDFTRKSTSSRRTSMFNSFSPKQEPIFMSSPQPSSAALSLPYAVGTPTLSLPYLVPQGSPYHMSKPSFRMLNTLFKDEIPKDLYKVELNKEGGVAGILVRDASDFTKANEFRPTYKRKDGKSYTVSCVHCNKPLLEYNHGIEKLFLLGNLREHYCNAIPISVLEEKYELLRSSRKITRQWWMRKSQEHNFPLQMRYTTACRILRNLRAV